MLAALGDRCLHKDLEPLLQLRQQLRSEATRVIAQDLATNDAAAVSDLVRLHTACLLGLSIELAFSGDHLGIERARALFRALERDWARRMRDGQVGASARKSRAQRAKPSQKLAAREKGK